ncbi:MAG TPA: protein translocase subunit SecD, partial [Pirellulales bacterium]
MNFAVLGVVVLAVAVAAIAAWFTSRVLRLPDLAWKVFVIVLCIDFSVVACSYAKPRLGIDLAGGVNLIYGLDESRSSTAASEIDISRDLIPPLVKRVDPSGLQEITVRPSGTNQVEIILPGGDEAESARIKQLLSQAGVLEFRILADRRKESALISRALEERKKGERKIYDEIDGKQVEVAEWTEVGEDKNGKPRFDPEDNLIGVYRYEREGKLVTEVLALVDEDKTAWVTGEYLSNASATSDESMRPAVAFAFNSTGAYLFDALTSANLPEGPNGNQKRHLAVVLDKLVQSAPTINSRIGARGQITGDFKRQEVDDMVAILKAGSMPAALAHEPLSEVVTDSTYGAASIRSGAIATVVSFFAVILFMCFYYRLAGVVASFALLLNLLFLIALMLTFDAAFTLPGIAGIVLTVGMAADANVLIYERMREELDRGASLRMAIRQGFAKAFSTIIDSNLTTLITATVLYVMGTDQIKGFAVTLWL